MSERKVQKWKVSAMLSARGSGEEDTGDIIRLRDSEVEGTGDCVREVLERIFLI